MKTRLRFLTLLLLLNFTQYIKAQSYVSFGIGKNYSTFKFSTKNIDDNIASPGYSAVGSTTVGGDYKFVNSKGLLLSVGLATRKAGASMVHKKRIFLWEMQYVDIKAGIGYEYSKWPIKPYAVIEPYYAYLLNGKQSIGSSSYDIKATKAMKGYDLGAFINLGLRTSIYSNISIFAEYNYTLGLKNIETEAEQYLYNRGFSVHAGLAFTIKEPQNTLY